MTKRHFKTFTIVLIIVLIIAAGFRLFILPNIFDRGQKQQNKNYPSLIYEYEVSKKLQHLEIPHKIEKNGTLRFSHLYQEAVDRAYKEVDYFYFPKWNNISFGIEKYHNQFITLLKENNIPFIIRKLDSSGKDYILWDPMCDDKATPLMKKVEEEMVKSMQMK